MDPSIAWAAGLFEGEGYISKAHNYRLTVNMTDRDVLERFAQIVGFGRVRTMRPATDKHKELFSWDINNKAEAKRIISMLLPFFFQRRAYHALNFLDRIELS